MNIVSTKLMGGLGNMMFQIAAAYNVSLEQNVQFICDVENMIVPHKPIEFYKKNIFKKIEFGNLKINIVDFYEPHFHYYQIPKLQNDVRLVGYFQSEKYFSNHKDKVLDLFEMDTTTNEILMKKYNDIFKFYTCSIHVRRGDYLKYPEHHPTLSIDYYKQATEIIGKDKHYLIFSDDLNWCEENFSFLENKIFINNNSDFEDLYLMSLCDNNIIANSTFSWWGAWMNQKSEKIVIAPKNWFGSKLPHNTCDLYCEGWYVI